MENLTDKTQRIMRKSVALKEDIKHTQQGLSRLQDDLYLELDAIEKELHLLQDEVQKTVTRAKLTVQAFSSVVKKTDVARVQSRIDAWGPENWITRREFNDLI